jgi:membrane associated rhomboid family serine protease
MKKPIIKIQYNAPVTLTFALASLGALLLASLTNGHTTALLFSVYRTSFADPLAYVRIFTHVLGHADAEHYFSNIFLFLLLAPIIEEKYGSKSLLLMILVTAFATGALNLLLFPRTALLGASGIVFMLIILSSLTNLQGKGIPLTFVLVAIFYIGQEIVNGLFVKDNVSQLAHIAGGICGAVIGFYLGRGKKSG